MTANPCTWYCVLDTRDNSRHTNPVEGRICGVKHAVEADFSTWYRVVSDPGVEYGVLALDRTYGRFRNTDGCLRPGSLFTYH